MKTQAFQIRYRCTCCKKKIPTTEYAKSRGICPYCVTGAIESYTVKFKKKQINWFGIFTTTKTIEEEVK